MFKRLLMSGVSTVAGSVLSSIRTTGLRTYIFAGIVAAVLLGSVAIRTYLKFQSNERAELVERLEREAEEKAIELANTNLKLIPVSYTHLTLPTIYSV